MTNKEKFLKLVENAPVADTLEWAKERQRNRESLRAKLNAELDQLEKLDNQQKLKDHARNTIAFHFGIVAESIGNANSGR